MEKLKLMARERAGWFSSTSAVVDAMSLLKNDERDAREALRRTGGAYVREGKEERRRTELEDRDEERGGCWRKKGIARTNPAEGKSQPRAEGYEFAGARRTTGDEGESRFACAREHGMFRESGRL